MARVTVEDCIEHLPNRFELVALAATRAKQIASGNPIHIERDNDKDTVVSLREIAESKLSLDALRNELTQNYQKYGKQDTIDEISSGFGVTKRADINDELSSLNMADEDDFEDAGLSATDDEGADLAFGDDEIDAKD